MSAENLFPNIPQHWRVTTLGELAKASGGNIQTGPFGSQLHASDYVDDGIPSIMPKNISVDAVVTDDIARVSPEDVERLSKYKVQTGDIIYSRRGDVEKCARITPQEDGWLCGTGCLRVRVRPGEVSTEYLHAYLCHPAVREWIVRHAVGATMPNLNTSILSALPIVIPSKAEMEYISSAWLNLSNKIQLNHQINSTLEQMAQAIFKSWFVDFEPVKAKVAVLEADGSEEDALLAAMSAISGKSPADLTHMQTEQPKQYAELCATAELFPSAMQESELGKIPEGWSILPLSEHTSALRGLSYKGKGLVEAGTPMHNLNSVFEGGGYKYAGVKHYSLDFKEKFIVRAGDLLVANTEQGHNHLLIGFGATVPHFFDHSFFSHHLYRLRPKADSKVTPEFLAALFRNKTFVKKVQGYANGTTVNMLPMSGVEMPEFVCPTKELAVAFSVYAKPLTLLAEKSHLQSQALLQLRDTLFPKLLSGELSVSSAEVQLAEVEETDNV